MHFWLPPVLPVRHLLPLVRLSARKAKGNAAFSAGRFDEAISAFSDAIALDPGNAVLYSNRSAAYASLDRWSLALADGQKAAELRPDWPKAYRCTVWYCVGTAGSDTLLLPKECRLTAAGLAPASSQPRRRRCTRPAALG